MSHRREAQWEHRAERALSTSDSLTRRATALEEQVAVLSVAAGKWKSRSDSTATRTKRRHVRNKKRVAVLLQRPDTLSPIAGEWKETALVAITTTDSALVAKAQGDSAYTLLSSAFTSRGAALALSQERGDSLYAVVRSRPTQKPCRVLGVGCKTLVFIGGVATGVLTTR
jgi:hypothetical protein